MAKKQTKTPSSKKKSRANAKPRTIRELLFETDSTYLLKLAVVIVLGTVWLRLAAPVTWLGIPFGAIPIGLIVGLILVKLAEAHQSDRKIWYVVLVIVALVTYGADKGIVI